MSLETRSARPLTTFFSESCNSGSFVYLLVFYCYSRSNPVDVKRNHRPQRLLILDSMRFAYYHWSFIGAFRYTYAYGVRNEVQVLEFLYSYVRLSTMDCSQQLQISCSIVIMRANCLYPLRCACFFEALCVVSPSERKNRRQHFVSFSLVPMYPASFRASTIV